MILSDEQMAIVSGAGISGWEPIDLPVGRQQLPSWLKGLHINWCLGVANSPRIQLKVSGNVRNWENQTWVKEGGKTYIARHPDGRSEVLYHDGAVTRAAAWRVFAGNEPITYRWLVPKRQANESWEQAAAREGQKHLEIVTSHSGVSFENLRGAVVNRADCRMEVKVLDITTQQSGFGGDGYLLTMADGSERMLLGPWHGGAPDGFVEANPIDIEEPYNRPSPRHKPKPWYRHGGTVCYLTEELMLRAVATFAPHVGMAYVQHSYGRRLECFDLAWGAPKAVIYEQERMRAVREEPASRFWRMYWDARGSYCGTLRIPTYGYLPEVPEHDRAEVPA